MKLLKTIHSKTFTNISITQANRNPAETTKNQRRIVNFVQPLSEGTFQFNAGLTNCSDDVIRKTLTIGPSLTSGANICYTG